MRCDELAGLRDQADSDTLANTGPAGHGSSLDCAASADVALQPSVAARVLIVAVRGYQILLSPLFAGCCRYVPSCSQFMAEAVRRHGVVRGGWLGVRRLARCHPLGSRGFDPVPDTWPPRPADRSSAGGAHQSTPGVSSRGQTRKITPGVIAESEY
jgi:uncharacterized protein